MEGAHRGGASGTSGTLSRGGRNAIYKTLTRAQTHVPHLYNLLHADKLGSGSSRKRKIRHISITKLQGQRSLQTSNIFTENNRDAPQLRPCLFFRLTMSGRELVLPERNYDDRALPLGICCRVCTMDYKTKREQHSSNTT